MTLGGPPGRGGRAELADVTTDARSRAAARTVVPRRRARSPTVSRRMARPPSFALDPAVAAAALRTPDTTGRARRRAGSTFAPETLDDHAADRAGAWFGSAYRRLDPRDLDARSPGHAIDPGRRTGVIVREWRRGVSERGLSRPARGRELGEAELLLELLERPEARRRPAAARRA